MRETVKHERYGNCDGFGPNGQCSQCTGLIERVDGSIVDLNDNVVRKAPLRVRLKAAWWALVGVKHALDDIL